MKFNYNNPKFTKKLKRANMKYAIFTTLNIHLKDQLVLIRRVLVNPAFESYIHLIVLIA